MGEFRERVAVVTGAASGIGFALAQALGERDAHVVMSDIDPSTLDAAGAALKARGLDVRCVTADVSDQGSIDALADAAGAVGPIEIACFNAGVSCTGATVWETDDATLDFVLGINLWGVVHSARAFIPRMIQHGRPGHVVITASMAGLVTSPTSGAYAASKAAAVAMAKAMRAELATSAPQLHVTLLNPGMVKTNLMRTSANRQPSTGAMTEEIVEMSHGALNSMGVDPVEAARWTLDTMESGRFWAFPPHGDLFVNALRAELAELDMATNPNADGAQ